LDDVKVQLERDHAIKILMVKENKQLCCILYEKDVNRSRSYHSSAEARHMTSEENISALGLAELKGMWKMVMKDATFKALLKGH